MHLHPFRLLSLATAALMVVALSACGFHLRGDLALPEQLHLDTADPHSRLIYQLKRTLADRGVRLSRSASTQLWLGEPKESGRVLSFVGGRSRERELILGVAIRVNDGAEERLVARRDYSYDELAALGSLNQEEQLREEMERELIERLLRRLARSGGAGPVGAE